MDAPPRSDRPAAWIETIDEADADAELSALYERARDPQTGQLDHILKVHSLRPATLDDHLQLYLTIMRKRSGLSRAEREMMAVVVSAINECHY